MEPAIFDTSVWVEFFNDTQSNRALMLDRYIQNTPSSVWLTPTIVQEILQGLRTEQDFIRTKTILEAYMILMPNWLDISVAAAKLYFDLRKKGVTIRKSTDCLIATVAIKYDVLLVHNDSDFDLIEQHTALRCLR
ncbi:MAG: PIN domain-containing protein [Spirosomaceae bacterium]|jgi:hypothetical protein|nr:PIN domain-containing protein [Spirosomataceae bacterium]